MVAEKLAQAALAPGGEQQERDATQGGATLETLQPAPQSVRFDLNAGTAERYALRSFMPGLWPGCLCC